MSRQIRLDIIIQIIDNETFLFNRAQEDDGGPRESAQRGRYTGRVLVRSQAAISGDRRGERVR